MKKMELTQGQFAIVDDEDFEKVNQLKWHAAKGGNTFYAMRGRSDTTRYMHWEIIGEPPAGLVTDHIDGNGLNNQKHNLRQVTRRQNCQNMVNVKSSSKYPGVHFYKRYGKWQAKITIDGKSKHVGYFDDEIDAFRAYEKAVLNLTGQRLITEI